MAIIKAGIAREADVYSKVWPSTDAAEVVQLLPVISEDIDWSLDQQSINTRGIPTSPNLAKTISRKVDGPIVVKAVYQGLEVFLTMAMGHQAKRIDGDLMPEDLGGGDYRHLIEVDDQLHASGWKYGDGWVYGDGLKYGQRKMRRFTWSVIKGSTIWEAKSLMINRLIFSSNPRDVSFLADTLGYNLQYNAFVNTGLNSLSCATTPLNFRDGILYIADVGAGSFVDEDAVDNLADFNLTLDNNLSTVYTRNSGLFIDEPARTSHPVVSGSFRLARFDSLMFSEAHSGDATKQALYEFVDGDFIFRLWFPRIVFTGVDIPTTGPQQHFPSITFMATALDSDPTGFPITTRKGPMTVEIVNNNSDHSLLD